MRRESFFKEFSHISIKYFTVICSKEKSLKVQVLFELQSKVVKLKFHEIISKINSVEIFSQKIRSVKILCRNFPKFPILFIISRIAWYLSHFYYFTTRFVSEKIFIILKGAKRKNSNLKPIKSFLSNKEENYFAYYAKWNQKRMKNEQLTDT